jgi:hypothetical protein
MPGYFKGYLQNFTIAPVGFVVPPGEDVTVQYEFTVRLSEERREGKGA